MTNRRLEMFEYRNILVRMRLGDSDRALAKIGLIGRLKAGTLRRLAITQRSFAEDRKMRQCALNKPGVIMTSQTRALQFVKSYLKILEDLGRSDDALAPFVDALRRVDETPGDNLTGVLDHPLMPLLEGALAAAEGPQDLIESTIDLAGEGGFQQVYEGEGISATQANYMVEKQIVGPKGRLSNQNLGSGIFFLAPNFDYPMHNHAGLEIYYVHSGVMHVQNGVDAEPRRVGPGDYSVTPSKVPHALYIGDAPVIILYAWTGDMESPIYWWIEEEDGSWTKTIA